MTLKEYLFRNDVKSGKFAKELGIHRNYLYYIRSHKMIPSEKLAQQIELLTGGQVTVAELRHGNG